MTQRTTTSSITPGTMNWATVSTRLNLLALGSTAKHQEQRIDGRENAQRELKPLLTHFCLHADVPEPSRHGFAVGAAGR